MDLPFYTIGKRSYALCVMTTSSMQPTIGKGELLLVEKAERPRFLPGDMLLMPRVRPDSMNFVHRLVKTVRRDGASWVVTKGDGEFNLDWPTPAKSVLGRVVLIRRSGGEWLSADGWRARLAGLLAAWIFRLILSDAASTAARGLRGAWFCNDRITRRLADALAKAPSSFVDSHTRAAA